MIKKALTPLSNSSSVSPKYLGLIRHILTIIGTLLMALGVIKVSEDEYVTMVDLVILAVGSIGNVIAMVSSWYAKEKSNV